MTERFQVHLKGIIELLSAHLYSGPEVVVRELLQNGVDAISARAALGPHPLPRGAGVRFAVLQRSDGPPLLRVSDDGIGLLEDEAAMFLATIGQSSKRDGDQAPKPGQGEGGAVEQQLGGARAEFLEGAPAGTEFLGQFGIGLLAGFLIADEIVVHSRSARTPAAPVIEWIGKQDGTWSSRLRPDVVQAVGTTVTLAPRSDCRAFVESKAIAELIQRYGGLLQTPVHLIDEEGRSSQLVGEGPPWQTNKKPADRARLRQLADEVAGDRPLAVVPLAGADGETNGVAFILSTRAPVTRRRGDRVYLKGMLVADDVELLPDWAIFARAVVDTRGVHPTASREALCEDEALARERDAASNSLRRFLIDTAKNDRALLEELISLHHLGLKQVAAQDDEMLDIFVDWFPFETSAGSLTFGALQAHTLRLHFTPNLDEFRQMAPLAAAHGVTLVNCAYTFDVDVLRAGCALRGVELLRLDAAALAARLEDVNDEEAESAAALVDAARAALAGVATNVEVKRFHPESLAAFYGAPESALRRRALLQSRDAAEATNNPLAGVIDDLLAAEPPGDRPTLVFNWRAVVVRRLAELAEGDGQGRELLLTAIRVLYAQALLLGHHPLGARELEALNGGLLSLVEAGIGAAVDGMSVQ